MFGEEKCGCYVVHVELDELEIVYCPKHKAIDDLYEALKALYNGTPDMFNAKLKAKQALAKAEVK